MKKRAIYKISSEEYTALAQEVCAKLISPSYFSGTATIASPTGEETLRLTASLIIYRRKPVHFDPQDEGDTIEHIVAVWWDFICEDDEGILEDDFDFERFEEAMQEI